LSMDRGRSRGLFAARSRLIGRRNRLSGRRSGFGRRTGRVGRHCAGSDAFVRSAGADEAGRRSAGRRPGRTRRTRSRSGSRVASPAQTAGLIFHDPDSPASSTPGTAGAGRFAGKSHPADDIGKHHLRRV
jgi:hypothetical protein